MGPLKKKCIVYVDKKEEMQKDWMFKSVVKKNILLEHTKQKLLLIWMQSEALHMNTLFFQCKMPQEIYA